MNQYEASQRRQVVIRDYHTGDRSTFSADKVYSITDNGIVVAVGPSRVFYPWHRIESFTYHAQDEVARKKIQGY